MSASGDPGRSLSQDPPDPNVRDRRIRVNRKNRLRFRDQVSELYATYPNASGDPGPQRSALERAARERFARIPLANQDAAALASRLQLNDACLALVGTYSADIDRYAARLGELSGDLPRFIALLTATADAEDPKSALLATGNVDLH